MRPRAVPAWCRRHGRRGALALALGAALGALLLGAPLSRSHRAAADLPRVPPAALAHLLADFSNQPRLQPHVGSWAVEGESGNYTWWRYDVAYSCGARCSGRAELAARAEPLGAEPRHGPGARRHVVRLAHRVCTRAPPLGWPALCDEWELESTITELSDGAGGEGRAFGAGGSHVEEVWSTRCAALRVAWGACGTGLRERARRHALRLRALLPLADS